MTCIRRGHAAAVLVAVLTALALPVSAQSPGYTEADVAFMQGMIPHHAQALDMVALVPERTTTRSITLIAERIGVSQRDEIAWMTRWLQDRGADVPEGAAHDHGAGHGDGHEGHSGHAGMDHGGMDHALMPGMLSPEEMARLAAARGVDFDRLFLQYMIRHHQGALLMVIDLRATPGAGQASEVFRFSTDVEADQGAEIARMLSLLDVPPLPAPTPAPHTH
ncbi:MAG TPA: DUF305 domain-containing protein [Rhodothermales bacterium]|nr:DUF305 domain-containing protein [Rhodothermales bacterium]